MAMAEAPVFLLAWFAGAALGVMFFGGLWWTVRKGVSSKEPARWFAGSLLLRTAIALPGVYFVSGGHWQRLLPCLVGFMMAQLGVTWMTGRWSGKLVQPSQEAGHASQSR
jgi:F1F0 ATPase subunit 2